MKLTKELSYAMLGAGLCAIAVVLYIIFSNPFSVLGSVTVGNEYTATSTAPNTYQGAFSGSRLIKAGTGALGSIVIGGAGAGNVCFYNATTSAITKRATAKATSTILLGCVAGAAAAGTYTFDVVYTDGLYFDLNPLDLGAAAVPTSTITYR